MPAVYDKEKQDSLEDSFNKPSITDEDRNTGQTSSSDNSSENDALEDGFNKPSIADEERNTNKPKSQEESALNNDSEDAPWNNKVGEKNKRNRFSFNKKRAGISGLATGLLIGGFVSVSSFLSGPLRIIHAAQLLKQFHFGSSEEFSSRRVSKLLRYARFGSGNADVQDYNLGRVGNKVAVHYEKILGKQGVDFNYGDGGRLTSISADPNLPGGKKFIETLESRHGISIEPHRQTGKVEIDFGRGTINDVGITNARITVNDAVDAAGLRGTSRAMAARLLKKRAKLPSMFHPIERTKTKLDDKFWAKYDEWKSKKQSKMEADVNNGSGSIEVEPKSPEAPDDPDNPNGGKKSAPPDAVTDAIDTTPMKEVEVEIKNPGGATRESLTKLKGKLSKATGPLAVLGILCGLDAIGDGIVDIQESNIIQPLIRLTNTMVLKPAAQLMYGDGITGIDISAIAESYYDEEAKTDFMSGQSIQHNLGKPNTGVPIPNNAKPGRDRPLFFKGVDAVTSLPVLSQSCTAINSGVGFILTTAADLVLAGLSGGGSLAIAGALTAAGFAGSHFFMDDLLNFLAGKAFDVLGSRGGIFGALADTGAFLSDNDTSMALGGRTLEDSENIALINENAERIKNENQKKPIYARLFDYKDSNSLLSRSLIDTNFMNDPVSNFASLLSSPFGLTKKFGSLLTTANPRAYAQTTPFDYGVDKIGFSIEERDSSLIEDPYENEKAIKDKLPELNEKYGTKCFGITIDPQTGKFINGESPKYIELEKEKDTCGFKNTDPDFLRYRAYIADTVLMSTVTCYESIDESACNDLGFSGTSQEASQVPSEGGISGSIASTPYESSVNVQCASGTNDLGVSDAYVSGQLVQHRFCAVTNLPSSSSESTPGSAYYMNGANGYAIVNARLSGPIYNMVNDAAAAGVKLTASSSFRTMAHQQALFNKSDGTGKSVAHPGGSSHQSGTAIDFANMGEKGGSSGDCSNRKRADGNKGWEWLFANAEKYGLKQYSYEPWHWDPGPPGLNNRCTSAQP